VPQLVEQALEVMSQEWPLAQSPGPLQPQEPLVMHTLLDDLLEQSLQSAPSFPQSISPVPGWHIPLLQQPPLHCPGPEQLGLHLPPLQALCTGQSVAELQPQAPLMHALPVGLPVQSAQADADPHAEPEVPDIQVPDAPAQQ
jgi:hypothetical protein